MGEGGGWYVDVDQFDVLFGLNNIQLPRFTGIDTYNT